MFEGEKTYVFWIGLIILGLALVGLFTILWLNPAHYHVYQDYPKHYVWFIAGAVVFILIGLNIMKSGVKRKKIPEP